MQQDPYVEGLVIQGLPYEGALREFLDVRPGVFTPDDFDDYLRDISDFRDWSMGGRNLRIGHGLTGVPTFFKRHPDYLAYAVPWAQIAKWSGITTIGAFRQLREPAKSYVFERVNALFQTFREAYVLRQINQGLVYLSRRGVPGDPYRGTFSGYEFRGKWFNPLSWRAGRKDFGVPDTNPALLTAQQFAQGVSRAQRNKFMPWNVRDALLEAYEGASDYAREETAEKFREMVRKDDVDHIFGPGDYSEVDVHMPYNRRTGQWYPSRRNYGFQRRRRYNNGGGYGARRRSYRRSYSRW